MSSPGGGHLPDYALSITASLAGSVPGLLSRVRDGDRREGTAGADREREREAVGDLTVVAGALRFITVVVVAAFDAVEIAPRGRSSPKGTGGDGAEDAKDVEDASTGRGREEVRSSGARWL